MDEITLYPDFDEFSVEYKDIWASGNVLDAYKVIKELLNSQEAVDKDLSYSVIMDKWKISLELWQLEYGELDPKYVGKIAKEKKKILEDFISEKLYLNEYSLDQVGHKRDRYLFPQYLTTQELSKIFNNITRKINDRREAIKKGKIKT